MKKIIVAIVFFFSFNNNLKADDNTISWLKTEIDIILNAYKNDQLTKVERFEFIEKTINQNFAGAGIAKFAAGKAWNSANKETKQEYVDLFKKHLALNIASMMQGYSDQQYTFLESKFDEKTAVNIIDMEVKSNTNSLTISWRVKKSKSRFYVIDLIVADISLVRTKRSEFNSMLKKVNYDLNSFNKFLKDTNDTSYQKITN